MPGQRSVKLGGTNLDWESGRVGKGAGTKFPDGKDSRAPCPRCHNSQLRRNAWARRTRDLRFGTAVPSPLPTLRRYEASILKQAKLGSHPCNRKQGVTDDTEERGEAPYREHALPVGRG